MTEHDSLGVAPLLIPLAGPQIAAGPSRNLQTDALAVALVDTAEPRCEPGIAI